MPKPELVDLWRAMLRIRRIEEAIAERYAEQQMRCPVHLSIGQEATAVGVCAALAAQDYVLSSHRSHGHYLARGGDLRAMLAELYGRVDGCTRGMGGSMHLIDLSVGFLGAVPIVGSTIPIAAGAALGARMRGEDRVTVAFFGDGATEEGVFAETLNFAALRALPLLLVCENNLYSVYSPLSVRQPNGVRAHQIAEAHGVRGVHGDGNDVEQVAALAVEAVARARSGSGPTLLELDTYRWREHCGPNYDNDIGYRSPREFDAWVERCPVARARGRLGQVDDAAVETVLRAEIDAAFGFACASPWPEVTR